MRPITSQMPPPRWLPTSLRSGTLEDAAHDEPSQRKAVIRRSADARGQAIILHPGVVASPGCTKTGMSRSVTSLKKGLAPHRHPDNALVAAVDDDRAGVILSDGALELAPVELAARGHAGGHEHELVRMLVTARREMAVASFDRVDVSWSLFRDGCSAPRC